MQKNKNNKYYRGEYNEESKSPISCAEKIEVAEENKDNVGKKFTVNVKFRDKE